jgi:acetyltransferase-like isoleucine patch superfamily enzyme
MRQLIKNPMTQWLYWLVKRGRVVRQNSHLDLDIGYMALTSNCKFGRFNRIYPGAVLNAVRLGDMSYVGERSRLSRAAIGKFTCIGPEVMIGLGTHPSRDLASIHPAFYSRDRRAQTTFSDSTVYREFAEVVVGSDVWIGARATVLDGVVIGHGAIIGAGAVVTSHVAPYAIVGGVPARLIRYRFDEAKISQLLAIAWWDRELDWLRSNYRLFLDVDLLLKHFSASAKN